ncbi:hypothetical protein AB1F57_07585 [Streptococcus sp. ZY1909104]|uniref:hypothetical protein n=1 Tax=Streptococcus sp. ZY1909104 TaxID=3233335 RepID=UPI00349F99B1
MGSSVDVYYNPLKPKQAYVHRHITILSKSLVYLLIGLHCLYMVVCLGLWLALV